MLETERPVAIIPSTCFRWRARVQFIETFKTRAAALNFAFQHDYNLVVERGEGDASLFDVLDDPDGVCTSGLDLELLKTEDVLVEADSSGWTTLMFWTVWGFLKRLATFATILYVRGIVPLSRRAATIADAYLRNTIPLIRLAAGRCRQIDIRGAFNRVWSRESLSVAAVRCKRFSAIARAYLQEVAPFSRQVASRFWWSDSGLSFRRAWHRHSHGTVYDLAKRSAAVGSLYTCQIGSLARRTVTTAGLYLRVIACRVNYAARQYRWADVEAVFRPAVSNLLSVSRRSGRLAATRASLYGREIVPLYRWAAVAANLYLRQAAAYIRNAAGRLPDGKSNVRVHSWASVGPRQSNPSRLH